MKQWRRQRALNEVERDLMEFLARRRGAPVEEFARRYCQLRSEFQFGSAAYKRLCHTLYRLFGLFYDDRDEVSLVQSYQFFAPMHLYRFVSYYSENNGEQPGGLSGLWRRQRERRKGGKAGDCSEPPASDFRATARWLLGQLSVTPVVVDYGCGLGYIAFEIGRLVSDARIYLVDVDCLTLEFAAFRFARHGLAAEVIPINEDRLYPELPQHNLCLATEVMEHLHDPLAALARIEEAMEPGGILYGDFSDHKPGPYHVTADLRPLRERLASSFEQISPNTYRKRR